MRNNNGKMIDELPGDLIIKIGSNLSYQTFTSLNTIVCHDISDKRIFTRCALFMCVTQHTKHTHQNYINDVLKEYGVDVEEFYEILNTSSFDKYAISELLYAINSNIIDDITKDSYDIYFDDKKTSSINIQNTIAVSKIIMMLIEKRIIEEYKMNNPYCFVNRTVINTLMNYFHVIVKSHHMIWI